MKKVSVIIGTKNEEKNISNLLNSIKNQTYPNIETIVIDNFSTDKTKEICEKYNVNFYQKGPERSTQRNFGAEIATGGYLLILDADMTIDPNVITECVKTIEKDKNTKAIIIPEFSFGTGYWSQCKALERNCYIEENSEVNAPRFFYRDVFLEVGGFDIKMISGEDWDLKNKLINKKHLIGSTKELIRHNEGNRSLIEIIRKKIYYAKNSGPYIDKNIKSFKDIILFIFRPALYKNIPMLIKHPFHFFGVFFLFYTELFFGAFSAILFKKEFWSKIFTK